MCYGILGICGVFQIVDMTEIKSLNLNLYMYLGILLYGYFNLDKGSYMLRINRKYEMEDKKKADK